MIKDSENSGTLNWFCWYHSVDPSRPQACLIDREASQARAGVSGIIVPWEHSAGSTARKACVPWFLNTLKGPGGLPKAPCLPAAVAVPRETHHLVASWAMTLNIWDHDCRGRGQPTLWGPWPWGLLALSLRRSRRWTLPHSLFMFLSWLSFRDFLLLLFFLVTSYSK